MAEFCKECAKELGFGDDHDKPPLFCEHCGKFFDKKPTILKKLIKQLRGFILFAFKLLKT